MCNYTEGYISMVLSQIECSETKKVVGLRLRSEIKEIIRAQHIINPSQEQLVNILLMQIGDPKTLGQYFMWLQNLMDLH